jgi:nucleoside-diphosphate-sugar epimerase
MRVFVTGATGFVGSAIVSELIAAGHTVLGLARNDANAKLLTAAGAEVHHGSLEDLDSLRSGAAQSDAVIHTAFIRDFNNFAAASQTDMRAIETMGAGLAGSNRPFVATSGVLFLQRKGPLGTEEDATIPGLPRQSEETALAMVSRGVKASVIRLGASVHGQGDHAFVPELIRIAREKGVSAYIGDGLNRWPAVHRLDAAALYRLAVEKGSAGARYHGIAEEGVALREIAEVIGRRLDLPVVSKSPDEAAAHFGWIARFLGIDGASSSALTQKQLGWRPTQPGLIADLDSENYFVEAGMASVVR